MYEMNEEAADDLEADPERSHKNPHKPHECVRCAKSFPSVHQLAQHTRVHTGEKPFKCSFCEKRFKQLSHVKQHTRLHTGERPYKCSEPSCGRTFIQLSNLQQHMSSHAKDPTGKVRGINCHCSVCGKGFTTDSSLCLHMEKKHKDLLNNGVAAAPPRRVQLAAVVKPKPYVCSICSKSYTTESALQIHSEKHRSPGSSGSSPSSRNPESPPEPCHAGFRCVYCPETFISAEGLAEHIKNIHSGSNAGGQQQPPPPLKHFPYPPSLPFYPPPSHYAGPHWLDPQGVVYPHHSRTTTGSGSSPGPPEKAHLRKC